MIMLLQREGEGKENKSEKGWRERPKRDEEKKEKGHIDSLYITVLK